MTLARTGDLVAEAVERRTAVLAFNVIALEHAEGILAGAERSGHPVVLQVSENAVRYHHGGGVPLLSACAELIEALPARAALHLDHVTDPDLLELGSARGVSSVMFDASADTDAENLRRTQAATRLLHDRGLFVEAELGAIGGKGAHTPGVRTDPEEAAGFVAATGVDALAVAVGSTHAMTEQTATLDDELVSRIGQRVPVPLVLHGSSGVPRDRLRAVVRAGITKINIGTALNVAFTRRVRELLDADARLTDPRRYLGPARDAVTELVHDTFADLLGPR